MSFFEDVYTDYLAALEAIDNSPYVLRPTEEARLRAEAEATLEHRRIAAIEDACLAATGPIDRAIAEREAAAQRAPGPDFELRIQRLCRMASEAPNGAAIDAVIAEATATRSEDTVRAVLSAGVNRHRALTTGQGVTSMALAARERFDLEAMAWRQAHPSTSEEIAKLHEDRQGAIDAILREEQHIRERRLPSERKKIVDTRAAQIARVRLD